MGKSNKAAQQEDKSLLEITPELEREVNKILTDTEREVPNFWEIDTTESFYVPVDDGEIKVYHIKPKNPVSKRPLVFIPGWGTSGIGFVDFYEVIHDKVECYYVETREKKSSKLDRKSAKMGMYQKAKDVQDVINYFELDKRDFVLQGTCWGSAIILQGLIEEIIDAPTIIAHDPMHTLWFPKWFLRYVSPILPIFVVKMIKPILKRLQLRGMNEEVQRKRAEAFVADAELWKWKRAADSVIDFELFGNISGITKEVFVTNGTKDKVHNQITYPKIASELPNGRFIFMKTDESRRERLMGLIGLEFSKITKNDGVPLSLREFEVNIPR
jgi:pimeloyl-ACP methyl ester carboxylesterase